MTKQESNKPGIEYTLKANQTRTVTKTKQSIRKREKQTQSNT